MQPTKFKIGDIYRYGEPTTVQRFECLFTVIDIIFEEKVVKGNWPDKSVTKILNNCYLSTCLADGLHYYTKFESESRHYLVKNKVETAVTKTSSCPNCKKDLQEIYSDWAKTNIPKCFNCGWC
jgi:hypothetical protein